MRLILGMHDTLPLERSNLYSWVAQSNTQELIASFAPPVPLVANFGEIVVVVCVWRVARSSTS